MKLHAQPEAIAAAVVSFPDTTSAVKTVVETLQCAIPMARMELLDQVSVKVNRACGQGRPREPPSYTIQCLINVLGTQLFNS